MWRELLAAQVAARPLRAVAAELGYSHATLSLVLNGKYDADTRHLEKAVLAHFGTVACPFEARAMAAQACLAWCQRDIPTSSAWGVRHWAACQACPHNLSKKENP